MLCCDKKDAYRKNEEDKKNYLISEMKMIIFKLIDDMVKNVKTIKICFIGLIPSMSLKSGLDQSAVR